MRITLAVPKLYEVLLVVMAMIAATRWIGPTADAALTFATNFEIDEHLHWNVNRTSAMDAVADFHFDYGSRGIPSAPNSLAGDSRGLKLQANLTSGVFGGVSVSPNNQEFVGDFTLEFDWWSNFEGPLPWGPAGSTNFSTFGVGTWGQVVQSANNAPDSVWFGATGDGGAINDYRAYSPAPANASLNGRYAESSGVYAAGIAAGSTNASNAYYSSLGDRTAPQAQVAQYPQQTGTTLPGSTAFEWHEVEVSRSGAMVTWKINNLPIATVDTTGLSLGGDNFFLGHSDINAASPVGPDGDELIFTLIDNVRVSSSASAPPPSNPGEILSGNSVATHDSRWIWARRLTSTQWIGKDMGYSVDPFAPVISITHVGDSEGNFLAINNYGGLGAWNQTTQNWSGHNLGVTDPPPGGMGFRRAATDVESSEGNFAVADNDAGVTAWNHANSSWSTVRFLQNDLLAPGYVIASIYGSDGNFAAVNDNADVTAWNKETSRWTAVTLPGVTQFDEQVATVVESQGNFGAHTFHKAVAAWEQHTENWATHDMTEGFSPYNGLSRVTSLQPFTGNFVAYNNTGLVALWNKTTGHWHDRLNFGTVIEVVNSNLNITMRNADGDVAARKAGATSWGEIDLGPTAHAIVESGGSFAFYNDEGLVAAWSDYSAGFPLPWRTVDLSQGSSNRVIKSLIGGEGNLAVSNNANQVSAFSADFGQWFDHNFDSGAKVTTLVDYQANYIAVADDGVAAVWDHESHAWTETNPAFAVQLATGMMPQFVPFSAPTPTERWSTASNWQGGAQPAIGSIVTLSNANAPTQQLIVDAPATAFSVELNGSSGTMQLQVVAEGNLAVLDAFHVGAGGEIKMSSGTVSAASIQLNQGLLRGDGIVRSSVTNGGVVAPGSSAGAITIEGDYTQTTAGTIHMELGGTQAGLQYDQLIVDGDAVLAGTLTVSLINGFQPAAGTTFDLLLGNDVSGEFSSVEQSPFGGALGFQLLYLADRVQAVAAPFLTGDFNADGIVNAADYTIWRDLDGTSTTPFGTGDANGDQLVDAADYALWRANFGVTPPAASLGNGSVPEPTSSILATGLLATLLVLRRTAARSPLGC
jgi:hypothetical protein